MSDGLSFRNHGQMVVNIMRVASETNDLDLARRVIGGCNTQPKKDDRALRTVVYYGHDIVKRAILRSGLLVKTSVMLS